MRPSRTPFRTRALPAVLACLLLTGSAGAQEVRSAVGADSVRVGDVVPVALRVTLEPGQRVAWPDTLPITGDGDVENAARVRERQDTLEDGRIRSTATYAVTPWRPGETMLPDVEIPVVGADEVARTLTASLPALDVLSVLPADTAGIEPRPPKDVIGRNWAWWPFLLLLLLVLAAIGGLVWWLRRRRAAGALVPAEPLIPPRERALAELAAVREAGLLERGETKEFYTRVSAAVRDYLAAVEPVWGEDLTTTELLGRFRAGIGPGAATGLGEVLRPIDQVKFARREPDRATALAEWDAAREWVTAFRWPPAAPEGYGEAA